MRCNQRTSVFKNVAALLMLLACLTPQAEAQVAEALRSGDVVAVCGDSITEQKLYSLYIEDYLLMCQPASKLEAMQFGWGGETSWGFLGRMKNDVLPFKPTAVTTCYGMNDGGYAGSNPERLTKYKQATESIVKTFKAAGVRFIVVGSPGVVDSDGSKHCDPGTYNKTLSELRDTARQVSAEQGTAFADVHGAMLDAMAKAKAKHGKSYHVAGLDGVHPAANGHLVMAYAFLKALGCSGDIGTITLDLKSNAAEAADGHRILSVTNGVVEVESSRYPFCLFGDPAKPESTRGIVEFFPFHEQLNRYRFVVKNASANQVKITWGKECREFSAADLEKGVNLAAEFPDNPFSEPFAKAESVLRLQQNFETPAVKNLLHALPEWMRTMPEEQATLDRLVQGLIGKSQKLRAASSAAVTPVKHTIKVETVK